MEAVITIKGKEEGNVSVILAGIHGDEPCGVLAFNDLLPDLDIEKGTVYFIYGNPMAIEQKKRYIELNLNRLFNDSHLNLLDIANGYEYKRAQFIKGYLDKSSALLDIHSAKKKTRPFIFCEDVSIKVASKLPKDFESIVLGADSVEPGATDGYMSSNGKIGICAECGQHDDESAVVLAKDTIKSFLRARDHLSGKNTKIHRSIVKLGYSYITKTNNFVLERNFKDFERINKGDIIGVDGQEPINAPFSGVILFARNQNKKNREGFLLGNNI